MAPGFEVTATSPDGVIEAMETPGPAFCVAVQWHPEMLSDQADPSFTWLVGEARRRHAG